METAPDGEVSVISRSRKEVWSKVVLISTNSTNCTSDPMVMLLETVTGVPESGRSGIARSVSAEAWVSSVRAGRLVQLVARSTAALASTTPKPYSWLNA